MTVPLPPPPAPSRTRKKIEWLLRRAEGALLPAPLLEAEGSHLAPAEARAKLVASADDVARTGHAVRIEQLFHAIDAHDPAVTRAYVDRRRRRRRSPVSRRREDAHLLPRGRDAPAPR